MIRQCNLNDFEAIYTIINDAAEAYKGVIPEDRWNTPYMTKDELQQEIDAGVVFWGYEDGGALVGVMGIQDVKDVTLIRHSYVRTASQSEGIGGRLLSELRGNTERPILIGTWATQCGRYGFTKDTAFNWFLQTKKIACSKYTGQFPSVRSKPQWS